MPGAAQDSHSDGLCGPNCEPALLTLTKSRNERGRGADRHSVVEPGLLHRRNLASAPRFFALSAAESRPAVFLLRTNLPVDKIAPKARNPLPAATRCLFDRLPAPTMSAARTWIPAGSN